MYPFKIIIIKNNGNYLFVHHMFHYLVIGVLFDSCSVHDKGSNLCKA